MGIGGYIGAWFGIDFLLIAHALTMISGQPIDEWLSCVTEIHMKYRCSLLWNGAF
jgi:hypothetical protein